MKGTNTPALRDFRTLATQSGEIYIPLDVEKVSFVTRISTRHPLSMTNARCSWDILLVPAVNAPLFQTEETEAIGTPESRPPQIIWEKAGCIF